MSSGQLGLLLLQCLERRQVFWKSRCKYSKADRRDPKPPCPKRLLFEFLIFFWEGGVLHGHVPLRDAADPAGQGLDLTWRFGGHLLLPVPEHKRPR